ncbi:trypsin-like serine peptidase [Novosphingobium album (ex Liu et al. 2023)]|uniref:Serine protease n=1 Tax=Novosphingobium album (ex Liu et al. 2023) TaxID=3031130 RepID=A0ABT5WT43_9SPHN|nr:serine protease [Novosphingobium album (ex Liu et al. 2023)]MDE8652512.1 serine protease [Novosphingobium album (ex Liu et al. 2023)]
MPGESARLAEWTTLSNGRFGECYVTVKPRGRGRQWEEIVALAKRREKRMACEEAEREGFLDRLTEAVVNWEFRAGRPAADIAQLLDRSSGYGLLQGMTDQQKGFMSAQILMPLLKVSQASAIVFRSDPVQKQIGTGFLVRPDLVLTAGHVALRVMSTEDGDAEPLAGAQDAAGTNGTWSDSLIPGLEFHFTALPGHAANDRFVVRPAAQKPLICSSLPHGTPPDRLDLSTTPPADSRLDFALIRLAQRVEHVDPVEIVDHVTVEEGRACWAFGFPGGNLLMMDVANVAKIEAAAGRWRHFANAAAGMSGGCCVNAEGQVAGLHEGTLELVEGGKRVRYNRGISMAAIRAAQCRGGADPLRQRVVTPGLEFQDSAMVMNLYRAGLDLGAQEAGWREQCTSAFGHSPLDEAPLPPFHPWFPRIDFERWVDDEDRHARLCLIHGAPGVGKSFTPRILRAKLSALAADLLSLSPTKTTGMAWEDAVSQELAGEDAEYRTAAAAARYTDVDSLIAELRRRSTDRRRKRFVALDFGRGDAGRLEGTPWFSLVIAMLLNDWIKVLLIGLDEADRNALADHLYDDPVMREITTREIELRHIGEAEFIGYAGDLAKARGVSRKMSDIRAFAQSNFVDLTGDDRAPLQTVSAALTAIVFERSLG